VQTLGIEVRNARSDDKQRCLDLLAELSSATGALTTLVVGQAFEQLLQKQRGEIIVATENASILGMATVSYNLALRYGGEYCQLEELIVSPAARGKNIGGLLVQRTIDNARDRGCADYGLYLVETTEHNRPFYEKYGFSVVGTEMRQRLID
jgi:GNAT superfamily N-acetyltransferase